MASDHRGSGYVKVPFGTAPTIGSAPAATRRAPQGPPRIGTGMVRNYNRPGTPEINLARTMGSQPSGEGRTPKDDKLDATPDPVSGGLRPPKDYPTRTSAAGSMAGPSMAAISAPYIFGALGPGATARPHGDGTAAPRMLGGAREPLALPFTAGGPTIAGPAARPHTSGAPIAEIGMNQAHSRSVGELPGLPTMRGPRMGAIDTSSTVRPRSKNKQAARDAKARASWDQTPGF
jgi:hypothetical protein